MENRQPILRFPEFSGKWEVEKLLKSVNSISSGKIKPSDEGDFLVYGSTGIIGKSNTFSHNGDFILVARVGANAGQINRAKGIYGVTDNTLVIDLKENVSISFCESFLRKFNLNKLIFGSGQPLITGGLLKAIDFNFPSLPEQTKIANFLTEVDKKLTSLKQKKTLLEQYKKGVMQQIFSQELRFKDDNGNDFKDWEEKKLGMVCDVRDGTHDSPKYVQKGFPFITSKNLMKDGSIDLENVSFITEIDYDKVNQRSKVDINDILFGMIGTIGNPVLVKSNGFAIKNVALIKEREALLNLFLIHFLKGDSINQQFFEQNTGGTQKFLSLTIIRNLIIVVPSIPEQTKIAIFLSAIDEKINHCQEQIEKTQVWKKGLLQQLFV